MSDEWDEDTTASELPELQEQLASPRNRPCLTVLTGGAAGQQFKLASGASTIGRAPTCAIRLDDDGISRTHARVITEHTKAWVEDCQSRNGTFVNGDRITGRTELRDGDKLQLGRSTVMRFGFQDALDESFHENLVSSALRDGLTRLFNKRYLMDRLDSELKFARRHETSLSLLMLDLDHFKKVNDTFGHLTGDAVLTHVASLLLRAVRIEDVVARFGGEEMAIVLRATGIDAASHTGERLRRTIEGSPLVFQGQELRVTVSVGVAGYPSTDAPTPEVLVEAADQALYRAKRAGRNRVSR
jgi:diguanylate cyclase (GGDEF)-like protein